MNIDPSSLLYIPGAISGQGDMPTERPIELPTLAEKGETITFAEAKALFDSFTDDNIDDNDDDIENTLKLKKNPIWDNLLEITDEAGLNTFLSGLSRKEFKQLLEEYTQPQGVYAAALEKRKKIEKKKNKLSKNYLKLSDKDKTEYEKLRKDLTKINIIIRRLQDQRKISYGSCIEAILFSKKTPHRMILDNMVRYTSGLSTTQIYHVYITQDGVIYPQDNN